MPGFVVENRADQHLLDQRFGTDFAYFTVGEF
jgi:hypothetical protein